MRERDVRPFFKLSRLEADGFPPSITIPNDIFTTAKYLYALTSEDGLERGTTIARRLGSMKTRTIFTGSSYSVQTTTRFSNRFQTFFNVDAASVHTHPPTSMDKIYDDLEEERKAESEQEFEETFAYNYLLSLWRRAIPSSQDVAHFRFSPIPYHLTISESGITLMAKPKPTYHQRRERQVVDTVLLSLALKKLDDRIEKLFEPYIENDLFDMVAAIIEPFGALYTNGDQTSPHLDKIAPSVTALSEVDNFQRKKDTT